MKLFFSSTWSWRQRCLRIYTGLQRNLTIYARWRISDPPPTPIKQRVFVWLRILPHNFPPPLKKNRFARASQRSSGTVGNRRPNLQKSVRAVKLHFLLIAPLPALPSHIRADSLKAVQGRHCAGMERRRSLPRRRGSRFVAVTERRIGLAHAMCCLLLGSEHSLGENRREAISEGCVLC